MSLPMKALEYDQLKFSIEGPAVETSGHEVLRVSIQGPDGKFDSTGFFKPLGETYPETLALYSVASSVIMRLSLGNRVAEERLVIKQGKILGTVSYTVPNFKPLLYAFDNVPEDATERELVLPSVATLLSHNVAEELVELWSGKEDDAHPGNFSLFGLIDRDMNLYNITSIMKGQRFTDGMWKPLPEKAMTLKGCDLDNFPIIKGRTHWPANGYVPGNLNVFKGFKASEAFQNLASNPVLQTETGTISFQEQMFNALLKKLVVFDPTLLKARLVEYFGDIPLNFFSLAADKAEKLSVTYPDLFNTDTDTSPFVDHMIRVYQKEYNELYRAVVFYLGCEANSKGVAVPSFCQYLQNKPSAHRLFHAWIAEQNRLAEEAWEKQEKLKSEHPEVTGPVDAHCFPPENRYNLQEIEQRFHKIWRDSHVGRIQDCRFRLQTLSRKVLSQLLVKPMAPASPSRLPLPADDETLTDTWQLFSEKFVTAAPNCDPDNSVGDGLKKLDAFILELTECTETYYKLDCSELTLESNLDYIKAIMRIIDTYERSIYALFANTTWSIEFRAIVEELVQFYGSINLERHLLNHSDTPLDVKARHDYSKLLKRQHTDKDIKELAIQTLFDWAYKLHERDKDLFEAYIKAVITECYVPSAYNLLADRDRDVKVETYLKTSQEDGANKLAYILSTGDCKSTSLNTMLIKYLMPRVLEDEINGPQVNLMSVSSAIDRKQFETIAYTKCAINYARTDVRFTHLYSDNTSKNFNEALYKWVSLVKRELFVKTIIKEALKKYEPSAFNFWSSKTRGSEVNKLLENGALDNSTLLALIFSNGEINKTSLNYALLITLLTKMKTSISASEKHRKDPDFAVILTVDLKDDAQIEHFLKSLAPIAKIKSFGTKRLTSGSSSSSTVTTAV